MTEIQWLVETMLNFKLHNPIKDRFIDRIGAVEAGLSRSQVKQQLNPMNPLAQAQSTQRILDGTDMGYKCRKCNSSMKVKDYEVDE